MIWPFRKPARQDVLAGIVADGASLVAAVVRRNGTRCQLLHCGQAAAPGPGQPWPLAELLGGHESSTVAVLDATGYQMLLVERPDVPDAEVAAAVRWRIKDLISFPIDEATVDVFDVPPQARGNRRMVYAVAARTPEVAAVAGGAGNGLVAIDVVELALRNLATTLPQDRFGVACLLLRGHSGFLTISRDRQVYLIRQMEIPEAAGYDAAAASQIALEVQRSLDYFESHYDQRPIRDVVLAPAEGVSQMVGMLSQEMAVNVALLDLNELLECPRELSAEEQNRVVLAVGAALRGPDRLEQAA